MASERSPLMGSVQHDKLVDPYKVELDRVVERLNMFTSVLSDFVECAKLVGTARDSREVRQTLHQCRRESSSIAKQVSRVLKKEPPSSQRTRHQKLLNDFQHLVEEMMDVSNRTTLKERQNSLGPDELTTFSSEASMNAGESEAGDIAVGSLLLTEIDDDSGSMIQDQNREIVDIEKEMGDLLEVVKDIQELVGDQGEELGEVEENTSDAVQKVEEAVDQLEKGYVQKKRSYKLMLIIACLCATIILILLCVLLIPLVILVVYFTVKFKKS